MSDYEATESLRRDPDALMREVEIAGHGTTFNKRECKCPFHDDHNASAGIFADRDGVWRFKCLSGTCGVTGDILEIRGMRTGQARNAMIAEVEGPRETRNGTSGTAPRPTVKTDAPKIYADMEAAFADYARWTNPYRPWWEYHNADGSTNCWTMRHDPRDGSRKKFAQFTPHSNGKIIAQGPGSPTVLYNLPAVLAADCVIVCEGEKAARAIMDKTGIVATTMLGGAGPGKAKNADWSPLSGKRVWLFPDNDTAGRGLMADVEKLLWELPKSPDELNLIDPAGMGLGEKGDAFDLLADQEGDPEELAAYLWQVIEMNSSPRDQLQFLDDHLARIRAGGYRAIPFPFPRVSKSTNALLPGTMTVIVGSAGSTKSFLMLFCLIHWYQRGIPCAMLAVEDALKVHTMRLIGLLEHDNRFAISDWCEEHDDDVQRVTAKHRREIAGLVKCILAAEDEGRKKRMTLADAMHWIEDRAKAGARIIIVDPVTLLAKGGNPWDADPEFIDRAKAVANEYGCSVIIVTHPSKGKAGSETFPSMGDIAGGAAWEQAGHTFLWFSGCYPDATSMCVERPGDMPLPTTHNRILYQLKARNGIVGGGPRYAIHFDPKTLQFSELGIIEPTVKKKGPQR